MRRRGGARRAAVRTLSASVERSLRRIVGATLLASATGACAVALSDTAEIGGATEATTALVVACSLLLGVAGIRSAAGRLGGREIAACGTALVAVIVAPAVDVDLPAPWHDPMLPFGATLLVIVAARGPRIRVTVGRILAVTLVDLVLPLAIERRLDDTVALREIAERALPVTGGAVALLVLLVEMRRSLERADQAIDARRSVEAEGMSAAEVEATSFLHDDLIPTLLGVAATQAADEATREVAGRVLERIEEPRPSGGGDLVVALRRAAEREGLQAEIRGRERRRSLPGPVHDAVLGAATEAMRNVVRHAGTDRVRLAVVRRRGRLQVLVEDDGVGFDARHGVGLRVAVVGRMRAVGGTAHVHSVPGQGTRVELQWQRGALARMLGRTPEHERLVRVALEDPAQAALRSCLAVGGGVAASGLLREVERAAAPEAWLGSAAIGALLLVVVGAIRRGAVPVGVVVLAALLPAAIVTAVLPGSGDAATGRPDAWIMGLATLPVLALAWVLTASASLIVATPTVLAGLAALGNQARAGTTPESSLLVATVPLVLLVPVLIVVAVCRYAGTEVVATGKRNRPDRSAAVIALLGPLALELRAVLAAAAHGRIGPQAAADAAVLARAVRDCLYLPGTQHTALRQQLTTLRRLGARVEITFVERPSASETLAVALAALNVAEVAQVTVSGTIEAVTVVAVPGVPDATAAAVERRLPIPWRGDYEPEAVVLTGPADLATVIRRGAPRPARG